MCRFMLDRSGNGIAFGMLGAALAVLLAGAMFDVYTAIYFRHWAYQMVGEAARQAVIVKGAPKTASTWFSTPGGALVWDAAQRQAVEQAARAFVNTRLAEKGIPAGAPTVVEIHALGSANGGTIAGFPPVPVQRANIGGANMTLSGPGVGVFLQFRAPTQWLSFINLLDYQINVFAAAEASEVPNS